MTAPALVNKSSYVEMVHAFRRQNLLRKTNRTVEIVLLCELLMLKRNLDCKVDPEGCAERTILQMLCGLLICCVIVTWICVSLYLLCAKITLCGQLGIADLLCLG